ncbi:MAG: hypothetical protein ACO1SV_21685 [Fimbriimonas sp.]
MAEEKRPTDWDAIRLEWDAGQLDIREIARQHNVTHSAIIKRAGRKGWPPRPESAEVVTSVVTTLVTTAEEKGQVVTNPRVALTAFHRTILLLLRHRKMMGTLADGIEQDLKDLEEWRKALTGRRPKLSEIDEMMTIRLRAAQAIAKLIPLERRAFGFKDDDAPSEFDGMTQEQLEAVEQTFRKALGG